jgi:aminomuconate-semialdehyde/2-hydroxymuconate-6-semialdehyde dehydrogenase
MQRILHFINGRFEPAASGGWLDDIEPATGQVYAQVADGDAADVDRAVTAAERAFPPWSRTPAGERSRLLLRLADLVERDAERLARAESVDNGKPFSLARSLDLPRAAANLRFFATAILHERSELHATDDAALNYTLRRPRGVAACISPWNLPLYLLTWKIAPALATGNTVVAKPSELTPMTAFLLAELCVEAGVPAGVINVVHGTGAKAGAALVRHRAVGAVTFTGGTATGADIARAAGPLFKKISLELGGKNPNVIFADADLDLAAATALRAAFSNQGQICLAGSRILVERPAFDAILRRLVDAARALVVGDPLDPATDQGALVSRAHRDKVLGFLELARVEGATFACGGAPPDLPARCRDGFFIAPTVLTGLAPGSRVNREEIFGPVVTVAPFDREDEAIDQANGVDYGLSAAVWTRDLDRAHRVAERLQCGTVWVNCWMLRDLRVPFGGTKASGVGREGGDEALRFFTEPKNVCIRLAAGSGSTA